jgi:hypothetical protein
MGPHDGAVDNEILHIWIMDEMLMHLFPDPFLTPACKAFIDTVPGTVMLRQQSPLGTATSYPEDCFDEAPAVGFLAHIDV